jgi:hypothetical protein
MSERDDGAVPEGRRHRRWVLPVLALTAAGAVLLIALVLGVTVRPASVAAGPRPSSTVPSTTSNSAPAHRPRPPPPRGRPTRTPPPSPTSTRWRPR